MFVQKKVLRLSESDASGVLYFAEQFRMAQQLFEEYLESVGLPLGVSLEKGDYLLPVVHAEADFLEPIRVGDELELCLALDQRGNSSFTLSCIFKRIKSDCIVGRTSIVHVVLSKSVWKSTPIPNFLLEVLEALRPPALVDSERV